MSHAPTSGQPPSPAAALLLLVNGALEVDRSADFLGYHITRTLRDLRDQLRFADFPRTFEARLRLTLFPYLVHDAKARGVAWDVQGELSGPLAPLFEIDSRMLNAGRGRAELSPDEFERYVAECRALHEEFTAARARMYNGEE